MGDLYNTFTKDRKNIPNYLKEYGDFDTLQKEFRKLEDLYPNQNIIRDMLSGAVGYKKNLQNAIYELPTKETISIIKYILERLKITKVEEIMAGTGLLTRMLIENKIDATATDGNVWSNTSGEKFTDVKEKMLTEYLTELHNDILYMLAWFPTNMATNNNITIMHKFIDEHHPKYLLMIGEFNYYKTIVDRLHQKYDIITIYGKQFCYKDYFKYNTKYPADMSHSYMMLCIDKSVEHNIKIGDFDKTLITDKHPLYTNEMYIQDLIVDRLYPIWMLDQLDNKEAIINISKMMRNISNPLPTYISNYDQLIFWYKKHIDGKYPKKIKTKEEFEEYYMLSKELEQKGIEQLKRTGHISGWVNTMDDAIIFLWMEFSSSDNDKAWKENKQRMNRDLRRLYRNQHY